MNLSKISLNLLTEEVYLQGMVNKMYENIMKEEIEPKEKHLVKKVADDFKLNADFIFTYSVGISGFIGPVKTLLENKGINVTEYDVTLLLMVVFYVLLAKSDDEIKKLMQGLKDKNLDSEVKPVLRFVTKTVGLFKIIGKKFGLAIQSLTDILAFTFLSLPVMNIIRDLADDKGFSIDRVDDLLLGLTLSAGAYTLKNIMKRK
jgi:hypothetical protein